MTEDQRFAATRPDVLVYKTEPLDHDLTVFGPISVDLKVSTTGTDSDFVVKVIDVYPPDYPDYNAPAGAAGRAEAAAAGSAERGEDGRLSGVDPRRAVSREIPQELREAGPVRARASRTTSRSVCPMSRTPGAKGIGSWCRSKARGSR